MRAAWRGDITYTFFPLSTYQKRRFPQPDDESQEQELEPSRSPGADLAKEIAEYSPSGADLIPHAIVHLAMRVGMEGSMSACNTLVRALFEVFPNAYKELLGAPSSRPFEYLWRGSEDRPSVPWDAPSEDEMRSWEQEEKDMCRYPATEDLADVLEGLKVRITYEGYNGEH